jgi:hypothetical protein
MVIYFSVLKDHYPFFLRNKEIRDNGFTYISCFKQKVISFIKESGNGEEFYIINAEIPDEEICDILNAALFGRVFIQANNILSTDYPEQVNKYLMIA